MPSRKRLTLVLATHNKHKVSEIKNILRKLKLPVRLLTLRDFPNSRAVVENRPTIKGNAIKKAGEASRRTGCPALADDTGLFIAALRNRPGVFSARFAGPGCTYEDNNRKVLKLLKSTPFKKRTAVFRCIAALATPSGRVVTAEGRINGKITFRPKGKNGFGYDPIFWIPKFKKTFAELSPRLKNRISHRAKAFQQIPTLIRRLEWHELVLI